MLRNYLKMALKVLKRRKFYTFISMFGITLTLAILLIVSAFWEHLVGQQAPEVNLDRSLMVYRMRLEGKEGWIRSGASSEYFMEKYVSKLQTPELVSFYTFYAAVNTFADGQKLDVDRKFTDAPFWQVMQHRFLEGRPYTAEEVARQQPVAVIARSLKEDLFGQESALGKEVKIGQDRFKVIGVIENTPITRVHSYGTLYIPYTLAKDYGESKELIGEFLATLVGRDEQHLEEIKREYDAMAKTIENPDPANIALINTHADPYLASFSRLSSGNSEDSGIDRVYIIISILAFLFMLLPTVNLININISRIMERAAEIGVRKAFGASSGVLIMQFIIENLVLTLLSGALAFVVAWFAIQGINSTGIVKYMTLRLNMEVFLMGMLFTLLFGFLSGVYPAWRMSKLHPTEALKAK